MAGDAGKQDEKKFDFTREGEALGYISLDQARVLAMRTAREAPGAYGSRFRKVPMAFEVVEDNETEDHYVVTLSFRPEGAFAGSAGQEQFVIEKEGGIAFRQVLTVPRRRGRLPVIPTAVGFVIVGGIAAVAAVFAIGGFGGGGDGGAALPGASIADPAPAVAVIPADTPVPTSTPMVSEVVAAAPPTPLPNSFEGTALPVGSVSFRDHYYLAVLELMTWAAAAAYAESIGGHLVTVGDDAENRFLVNLAQERGSPHNFWIGLSDQVQEGIFLWVNGESSIYSNWNTGEPNNAGNEDYVMLDYNACYFWNDVPVGDVSPFIVEFEATLETGAAPTSIVPEVIVVATPTSAPTPIPTQQPQPTSTPALQSTATPVTAAGEMAVSIACCNP